MKITKSGFYKIENTTENIIEIGDDLTVIFFDNSGISLDLKIGKNSKVEFYGFLNGSNNLSNYNTHFLQNGENSILKLRYLLFSKDLFSLKSKIKSEIDNNFSKSDFKIISILGENGNIDLDGIIEINKNLSKVEAKLEEENVFLGETGTVSGIPTLLVKSDDVIASHSCKIDKIDDKKIFYLRSRGIDKTKAIHMILESYFVDLFRCISMLDKILYEELKEEFFGLIRK